MPHRKKIKFTAFLWHRRIGLAAIILVIILAITGIALNHTERFNLDSNYVQSNLILNWYGLQPEGELISYQVDDQSDNVDTISSWDSSVFFNANIVAQTKSPLRGAIKTSQLFVAAFDTEIILMSHEGELIERMPTSVSFSHIKKLGIKYDRPVIETTEPYYYMADEHILDWDIISNEEIIWSKPFTPDETFSNQLLEKFRGKGITLERFILDLHSGRILGDFGVYLMDSAAIALLWLSFSGLWVWSSRRKKQRIKRHYIKHHRDV